MMSTDTVTTVTPLPKRTDPLLSTMVRRLNRSAMVKWINDDLPNRCGNDVNKSTVFYDADGDFVTALPASQWASVDDETRATFLQRFYQVTRELADEQARNGVPEHQRTRPVVYYSKGVK